MIVVSSSFIRVMWNVMTALKVGGLVERFRIVQVFS